MKRIDEMKSIQEKIQEKRNEAKYWEGKCIGYLEALSDVREMIEEMKDTKIGENGRQGYLFALTELLAKLEEGK